MDDKTTRSRGRPSHPYPDHPFAHWFLASGLSRAELAPKLGIKENQLGKLLRGQANPSGAVKILIERLSKGAVPSSSWIKTGQE